MKKKPLFQIIKNQLKRFWQHLTAYRSALFSNQTPENKFVLFFRPRSGSNLLVSLLNSHPQIYCDGEILGGRLTAAFPRFFLKGRSIQYRNTIYGFKLNIGQILQHHLEPQAWLTELHQHGWKIIYIERTQLLQQALSFFVAQQRDKWIGTPDALLTNFKIRVDCNAVIEKMQRMEQAVQREKDLLKQLPYVQVTYEEDLLDKNQHQQTLDRVFEFLQVPSVAVKTQMMKIAGDKKISDIVENFDELQQALQGTPYTRFLDSN
ncbi:MAG: hypothetical protein SVR94_07485 [Pseudomonadota bacterium]|nr:hypothetical protein [Pseudomonadota bacterium]